MAREELSPHSIVAALRMVGRQRTQVSIQHAGTPEATVTVSVGRSVIYLHTRATAERFGSVWQNAAVEAVQLPIRRPLRPPAVQPPDVAEPSVVVHAAGQPAGVVRIGRAPGAEQPASHLHVQIGNLIFLLYDQRAFSSCAEAFIRASKIAAQHLTNVDLRLTPVQRQQPTLDGHAAERATRNFEAASSHPAARAAAAYLPPRGATSRLGLRKPDAAPQIQQQPAAESRSRLGLRKPGAIHGAHHHGQPPRPGRGQTR